MHEKRTEGLARMKPLVDYSAGVTGDRVVAKRESGATQQYKERNQYSLPSVQLHFTHG